MSWTTVATIQSNQKSRKLKVKYNIDLPKEKICAGIPRYREITPDLADDFIMTNTTHSYIHNANTLKSIIPPNWDGGWLHYEAYKPLKQHKKSLPISIQRIIEWNANLIKQKYVIHLDFNEIDNDLKYQYNKYKQNPTKLKELYFKYWDYFNIDPTNYSIYFGAGNETMFDFLIYLTYHIKKNVSKIPSILNQLNVKNRMKAIKQVINIIKLLIKRDIIDVEDRCVVNDTEDEDSIWRYIKTLIFEFDETKYSSEIIDELVDLFMIVAKKKKDNNEPQAILKIVVTKSCFDDDGTIHCDNLLRRHYQYSTLKMNNNHGIIEKLLVCGIDAFQICERWEPQLRSRYIKRKNYCDYLKQLLNEKKITEPLKQFDVISPLILSPYLNGARERMSKLLSGYIADIGYLPSNDLSYHISKIITFYSFFDLRVFYDEKIQNNLNVKSLIFINSASHFKCHNNLIDMLKNKEVCKYMVDNYLYYIKPRDLSFEIMHILIETYNKESDDKFPLDGYGIYKIIGRLTQSMVNNVEFLCKLLKYVKGEYGKEFDINHEYDIYGTTEKMVTKIMKRERKNHEIVTKIIKFILSEFGQEYDINNPCLLYKSIFYKNISSFEYLITNYDYSLSKICEILGDITKNFLSKYKGIYNGWSRIRDKNTCKPFLKCVKKYCLQSKCKNDQDIQLLNQTLQDMFQCF